MIRSILGRMATATVFMVLLTLCVGASAVASPSHHDADHCTAISEWEAHRICQAVAKPAPMPPAVLPTPVGGDIGIGMTAPAPIFAPSAAAGRRIVQVAPRSPPVAA